MAVTFQMDGFSSTNVGLTVRNVDTRRAFPTREFVTQMVPQTPTRVLTAPDPEYDARQLEVETQIRASDSTTFKANRDDLLSRLDANNTVRLQFSDSTDRVYFARLTEASHEMVTMADPNWDDLKLTFDLLDPFAREATHSSVSISTAGTLVPLGTGPVFDHRVRIFGPSTNPSLILRRAGLFHYQPASGIFPGSQTFTRSSAATYTDAGGVLRTASSGSVRDDHYVNVSGDHTQAQDTGGEALYRTDFTLTMSTGEYLEIDMGSGTIVDDGGTSRHADRDTGTDFPWELDPRDGRYEQSTWPRIQVTGARGGELYYRKSWL